MTQEKRLYEVEVTVPESAPDEMVEKWLEMAIGKTGVVPVVKVRRLS